MPASRRSCVPGRSYRHRLADRLALASANEPLRLIRFGSWPPATARPSAARSTAALELFADHGVGGTSLQMIADAVGVTKAAIYHQFNTKEAIVLGVIEVQLVPLEAALEEAESAGPSLRAARGAAGTRDRHGRRTTGAP